MRPKLKICGINDVGIAAEASRLGVDYVGVIFAARSPRRVSEADAAVIVAAAREARPQSPPRAVGVFAEGSAAEIARIAAAVRLDVVQLHGRFDAAVVGDLKARGLEVWQLLVSGERSSPVNAVVDPDAVADPVVAADAVLVDGRVGDATGGTGRKADWSLVGELKRAGCRVVLAGGLSESNLAEAAATGADVLDVNSSLETAPGVKSLERVRSLLRR